MVLTVLAVCVVACGNTQLAPVRGKAGDYDSMLLGLKPFAYYHVAGSSEVEEDLAGANPGRWTTTGKRLAHVRLPDGTDVVEFRAGDYVTIQSAPGFSIPTTGRFTVIAWMRPDTLQFVAEEGSGYVHWLGKGKDGAQEWTLRMYSLVNEESRPNRISGYVYNPDGGEGSGAYVQDPVIVGQWLMIGFEVSTERSQQYPTGWVAIFRDGIERKRVALDQFSVTPHAGPAPVRIGTRDLESFFQGGIGDVAVFDRLISASDMQRLYAAMVNGGTRAG